MKKIYLALVAMMFAFNATFAQDYSSYTIPEGSTDLKELTGTEPNWANTVKYPTTFAPGGNVFGNGEGSNESTHVDVSAYESITIIVTEVSSNPGNTGLRIWMWDGKGVTTIYPYPAEDYSTVTNWTAATPITAPGVYRVKLNGLKDLKGMKAASNWGGTNFTVSCAYCTPAGVDPTPKVETPDTPYEVTELKPTKEVEVSLESSMFKGWDTNKADAKVTNENPWWDGAYGTAKDGGGVIFGNGNVNWLEYADLTGFETMTIYGEGGELRVMFNRVADQGALTEIKVNPTAEGTVIDLSKEFTSTIHLNCIKVQWGATATVSDIVLSRAEYVYSLEDAMCSDKELKARAIVTGAKVLAINPDGSKTVTLKDFDGNTVAKVPVGVSTYGKLELQFEEPMPAGDYYIKVAPNTLIINGAVYNEALSSILAVGEKDASAEEAFGALKEEMQNATDIENNLIYGVNVFQYAPGLKNKIQSAINEAEYYGNLLVEEEHIFNVISDLRQFMKDLRPNLPKAESKYAIKHKATGLYLNIDGENVTLQKEAYPIQFHLAEAAGGPVDEYGWDQVSYTYHRTYIYSTPDRKYLGYDDHNSTKEKDFTLTNKQNHVWYVETDHTNNYFIEIAYNYNNDYFNWGIYAAPGAKEGTKVTFVDAYNENNSSYDRNAYYWFIEDYIEPETTEPSTGNSESSEEATEITSVSENANAAAIYNASGARTNSLSKGLNIIKLANGKVVKVLK